MLYRALEYRTLELDWSIATKNETIDADLKRLVAKGPSANSLPKADKEAYMMDLADAVREADKFRIKSPISEKARVMLDKFCEERVDPKTKRMLMDALESKDKASPSFLSMPATGPRGVHSNTNRHSHSERVTGEAAEGP